MQDKKRRWWYRKEDWVSVSKTKGQTQGKKRSHDLTLVFNQVYSHVFTLIAHLLLPCCLCLKCCQDLRGALPVISSLSSSYFCRFCSGDSKTSSSSLVSSSHDWTLFSSTMDEFWCKWFLHLQQKDGKKEKDCWRPREWEGKWKTRKNNIVSNIRLHSFSFPLTLDAWCRSLSKGRGRKREREGREEYIKRMHKTKKRLSRRLNERTWETEKEVKRETQKGIRIKGRKEQEKEITSWSSSSFPWFLRFFLSCSPSSSHASSSFFFLTTSSCIELLLCLERETQLLFSCLSSSCSGRFLLSRFPFPVSQSLSFSSSESRESSSERACCHPLLEHPLEYKEEKGSRKHVDNSKKNRTDEHRQIKEKQTMISKKMNEEKESDISC